MEISMASILNGYGYCGQGLQLPQSQQPMGKNAWRSRFRILWEKLLRHYTTRHKSGRRSASSASYRWQDQFLSYAQILRISKWCEKRRDSLGDKNTDGRERIFSILPIPYSSKNPHAECTDQELYCEFVAPDVDAKYI